MGVKPYFSWNSSFVMRNLLIHLSFTVGFYSIDICTPEDYTNIKD